MLYMLYYTITMYTIYKLCILYINYVIYYEKVPGLCYCWPLSLPTNNMVLTKSMHNVEKYLRKLVFIVISDFLN